MIIIFDMDGTLVDTYPIIRKSFIEVINKHLPDVEYNEEMLESFFGPPLADSFAKLTDNDRTKTKFLISEYRKVNKELYEKEIKLFPGVLETLEKLKEYKLVVLSNRVQELVELGLTVTGIHNYFDLVFGLDELPRPKPYPDGIYKILDKFDEDKAVFIGDATTDIISARRAHITSIGVTWAITKRKEFEEEYADYIIDSFEELIKILEEIDV